MKLRVAKLIATWFGCGYAPVAPGTAGSLAALAIAWLLTHYAGWQPYWFAVLVVVSAAPAIWAADVTALQRKTRLVVVDEVLGQWVAGRARPLNEVLIGAFVLFRRSTFETVPVQISKGSRRRVSSPTI
jgi:phosphatidylglycerophosphatase A